MAVSGSSSLADDCGLWTIGQNVVRTATATAPARPIPESRWTKTFLPWQSLLTISRVSGSSAGASCIPEFHIGKVMCSHGTVPARNLAYAGDLCRVSSGEARHTTHLIFLSTISVRNSSKGSYRPGILCRKRWPSKFSGSSTRRIIGGFHTFLLSYLDPATLRRRRTIAAIKSICGWN